MFTYKAVEANSKVIACDIARYLYGGNLESAGADAHVPCAVQNGSGTPQGIILMSSGSTLLPDFQLWRADMAMMNSLETRADQVCVAKQQTAKAPENTEQGSQIGTRGLLGSILADATPAGAAASSAQQVLGMMASSQSVMSVVGTVQDPALMNEVARQLRALNVQVLLPEMYNPNALGGADYSQSPYMNDLQKLFADYDKCDKAKASYGPNSGESADITSITASIDAFLKSAFATSGPEVPGGTRPETAGTNTASSSQAAPIAHFTAVLAADELAREMGFTGNGAGGANPTWQHVLWLQALESGGSVSKTSNLFGSKVMFGGGAVDTYSVFRLDGQMVCSGNVYSFQPPVKMTDLEKAFRKGAGDDPTKSPLLDTTCGTLPPAQH